MRNATIIRISTVSGLGAVAVLSLAGCVRVHHDHHQRGGRPMVVADKLDCPPAQGFLDRVSVSPDGNTCEYRRSDGELVTLTRLPLNGQTPQVGLTPIEASLKALLPPRTDNASAKSAGDNDDDKDSARIDVPGVHIDAHGKKAQVRVFGVTIDADNDKANVHAGLGSDKATVSADESGAEVRATDITNTNANIVLVLASEKPGPTGLRAVGYMARGPVTGPLVVAEFKGVERHTGFNDDHDVRKLLDLNISR
jgi:hypothetical protein